MEISTKKKRFDGQIIVFLTSIDIKILNAMKGNHYLHRSLENLIPLIVSFLPVAAEREAINSSNMTWWTWRVLAIKSPTPLSNIWVHVFNQWTLKDELNNQSSSLTPSLKAYYCLENRYPARLMHVQKVHFPWNAFKTSAFGKNPGRASDSTRP